MSNELNLPDIIVTEEAGEFTMDSFLTIIKNFKFLFGSGLEEVIRLSPSTKFYEYIEDNDDFVRGVLAEAYVHRHANFFQKKSWKLGLRLESLESDILLFTLLNLAVLDKYIEFLNADKFDDLKNKYSNDSEVNSLINRLDNCIK